MPPRGYTEGHFGRPTTRSVTAKKGGRDLARAPYRRRWAAHPLPRGGGGRRPAAHPAARGGRQRPRLALGDARPGSLPSGVRAGPARCRGERRAPGRRLLPGFFERFVAAFLDALGIERAAAVVGNSLGGLVGLRLALSEPGRVAALGLVAAA